MRTSGSAHFGKVKALFSYGRGIKSFLRSYLAPIGLPYVNPVRSIIYDEQAWLLSNPARGHFLSATAKNSPLWPEVCGVYDLNHVSVHGDYSAYVLGNDFSLLGSLSQDVWAGKQHRFLSRLFVPRMRHLAGVSVLLSSPEAEANYWHWLIDLLPKIQLLKESSVQWSAIDRFLVHSKALPFQTASLVEAGIPVDKLHILDQSDWVSCERLIVPSLGPRPGETAAAWKIDALARMFPRQTFEPTTRIKRIFLSRRGASFRRIRNFEAVSELVEKHWFTEIDSGSVSFREQRALFAGAEVVLGVHGAALTNLAFASPGLRVFELVASSWRPHYFASLSNHLRLAHRTIECDSPTEGATRFQHPRQRDLIVDVSALDRILSDTLSANGR